MPPYVENVISGLVYGTCLLEFLLIVGYEIIVVPMKLEKHKEASK